jgi:2-aminophenol/2-amino-5-chlorophenol 1,6-dioxygenase alpha subunit
MNNSDFYCGAALVPSMPHLHAGNPAQSWHELAAASRDIGTWLRSKEPDLLVVLSTQWFTVLGHQLQMDPNPHGQRIDENWYDYDYGHLQYDLRIDTEFTEIWAQCIEADGFQARRTNYQNFPIDTGIITAHPLIDPDNQIPLALISCNLYAAADDLGSLAAAALRAAQQIGRRIALLAVTGLSSALIQRWIDPGEDRIESAGNEKWDRHILDLLAADKLDEAFALREQYAQEAQVDSQFRALSFLAGSGCLTGPAHVRAYGPIWGTGAAAVNWSNERV